MYQAIGASRTNQHQQFRAASEIIKSRIAESFARRRIRFDYLKEHQKKRQIDVAPELALGSTLSGSPVTGRDDSSKSAYVRGETLRQNAPTVKSKTVDTIYNATTSWDRKKGERAESVITITAEDVEFPNPPKVTDGRFQCPYCLLDFRQPEAEKSRWK
jgi:hypothetical protein